MKKIFLAILMVLNLCVVSAQESSRDLAPVLDSPRAAMMFFLRQMKQYKLGNPKALDNAIITLNLEKLDQASKLSSGRLAAIRLIQTIDKLEYIKPETIPATSDEKKWVFKTQSVTGPDGPVLAEIAIAPNTQGVWSFTPETIKHIDLFFQAVKQRKNVQGIVELITWKTRLKKAMPAWTGSKTFLLLNGQWIALFAIILLAFILDRLFRLYVAHFIVRLLAKRNITIADKRKKTFVAPFGIILFALTWILSIPLLELQDSLLGAFLRAGHIVITCGGVWACYHLVDIFGLYFEDLALKSENKFDDILVPLLRKSAKVFVLCVGAVFVAHSLTLNVTNVLAGLGIGGLAFALAAKDTLSNLFGSLTVILDRPFHIGDWVNIGGNIDGTVIELGFRSTRVKTFYDSVITVPNSQLTNIHIDNYGKRAYRRFTTTLGLEYDTPPKKIEAFCEGIRQLILKHPHTRKDYFHVYFKDFGAHSLDVMVYLFWKVPDWSQELAEKHRLLLDILRLGNDMNIGFAFPTQTLHMFSEDKKIPPSETGIDAHREGEQLAQKVVDESFIGEKHRSGISSGSAFKK